MAHIFVRPHDAMAEVRLWIKINGQDSEAIGIGSMGQLRRECSLADAPFHVDEAYSNGHGDSPFEDALEQLNAVSSSQSTTSV